MQNNFWGDLIKSLREEKDISQRQLASDTQVNRSTLRRIEDGATPGDIDTVESLLKYLGYELEAVTADDREERKRREAAMMADPARRSQLAAQRILSLNLLK